MTNQSTLRVKNWTRFQHYKNRRPPWIKLHADLLNNRDWHAITGDDAKLLVELWLVAADLSDDGTIPLSIPDLAFRLRRDSNTLASALKSLCDTGFLRCASTALADAAPETETETETEKETVTTLSETVPVSSMWQLWIERFGGEGKLPKLTTKRKTALRLLYLEQLKNEPDPLATFDKVLHSVMQSDYHMGKRAYQFPESLFLNEDRRDRWVQSVVNDSVSGNGKPASPVRFY